jgi:hypothetical protein
MTARESSIVDSIERAAARIDGLVLRKRHGTAFGIAGDPDFYGCFKGRHIEIELKRPGEEPTRLQRKRLTYWSAAGAITFWCTSPQEFVDKLRAATLERVCNACGSMDTSLLEGRARTGVSAPDGTQEWRSYTKIYCRDCGNEEER